MKTITLKPNGLGRYEEVSPFIIADKDLELSVELPEVSGIFVLIAENNGQTHKKTLEKGKTIKLKNLTAGYLNATVKHYLKGTLIRQYAVEPLVLVEVDTQIKAIPEIEELKQELVALKQEYDEFKTAIAEKYSKLTEDLAKWQQSVNAKLEALIKFAYTDYSNNVYLGGNGLQGFLDEFKFDLTESEIKALKGDLKDE